jgi:TRAP-type C4-dicarboxylate transport system substrate-binding protein
MAHGRIKKLNPKKGAVKMKKSTLFLVLAAILTVVFSMGAGYAKTFKWRAQSAFARGDFSADLLPGFAEEVKKKSNSRLIISTFYAGDLVPSEDTLKATSQGIIEIGQTCGALWQGVEPILGMQFGIPFGYKGTLKEIETLIDMTGLYGQFEAAYARQNCQLLGIHTYGPYPALVSNKPVRSYEDFKGLKVRALLGVADLLKHIGASPGYIPGGEIYMALKLGTFDAATYSIDAIRGFKWHEVIKYYILPYWVDYYFGDIVVNKDAWNKLPEDLQKILKEAMVNFGNANKEVYEKEKQAILDMQKELGYEVVTLPDAEVEKIRKVAIEKVWPAEAKKSPENAKAIEAIKKYLGVR